MSGEFQNSLEVQAGIPAQSAESLRVLRQLDEGCARIVQCVEDVRSFTEAQVLACGNVLSQIVDNARHLTDESESALALSIARSEETNRRFIQGMREDILAQTTAVQDALRIANGMEDALSAINDLTVSSRVLAVNARIEAARLGEHGRGFAVIADSLSVLSKDIRSTSDKVSSAIAALRKGLVPVSAQAVSMQDRTRHFVDEVGAQVKLAALQADGGTSNGRLTALIELSNQALSHLQFQDPASQKLQSINRDLDFTKERVRRVLNGEGDLNEAALCEAAGHNELAPGELMLF